MRVTKEVLKKENDRLREKCVNTEVLVRQREREIIALNEEIKTLKDHLRSQKIEGESSSFFGRSEDVIHIPFPPKTKECNRLIKIGPDQYLQADRLMCIDLNTIPFGREIAKRWFDENADSSLFDASQKKKEVG